MGFFRRRGSSGTGTASASGGQPPAAKSGASRADRLTAAMRDAGQAFHAAEHGMWEAYLQRRDAAAAARSLIREARAAAAGLPADDRAAVLARADELEAETTRSFDELVVEREMKLMEAGRRGPGWTVEFSPRRFGDRYAREEGEPGAG